MGFTTRFLAASITGAALLLPAAPALAATPTPAPSASTSTAPANPARDIRWQATGDHTAKLTWTKPSGTPAGQKVHYVVLAEVKLGKKVVANHTESDTTATSISYKDIPAGATVSAEVTTAARFVDGKHDKAPKYTQPQLKPSGVQKLSVSAAGVSVKATWQAPKSDAGTLLTGYRAELFKVTKGSSASVKVSNLKADRLTATFTKLSGETSYYVSVQAVNSEGAGKAAKSTTLQTGVVASVKPSSTPKPTTPSAQPSAQPTASATPDDANTLAPGVTVPSQHPVSSATGDPAATPTPTAVAAQNPTGPIVAVLGGIVVVLGILGFVGYRLYRRYV